MDLQMTAIRIKPIKHRSLSACPTAMIERYKRFERKSFNLCQVLTVRYSNFSERSRLSLLRCIQISLPQLLIRQLSVLSGRYFEPLSSWEVHLGPHGKESFYYQVGNFETGRDIYERSKAMQPLLRGKTMYFESGQKNHLEQKVETCVEMPTPKQI